MTSPAPSSKRKRSRSFDVDHPTPPLGVLEINYLARQNQDFLPLISIDDPLPSLLSAIADYNGVLERHESLAGNLGARPLGPILMKRFERLFDGPPRILKSSGKDATRVGWLDVVECARDHPDEFSLQKTRDGVRVCQFFIRDCHVEISEDDYQLISSGIPRKMIPPQPILEDEEKELGTLEILDRSISQVVQLADQVSGRARQINRRLSQRKSAIIGRREAEAAGSEHSPPRSTASSGQRGAQSNGERISASPTSGFVAVNQRISNPDADNKTTGYTDTPSSSDRILPGRPANANSTHNASAAVRDELLSKFFTNRERATIHDQGHGKVSSLTPRAVAGGKVKLKHAFDDHGGAVSGSPVPIPHTPSSLLPYSKSTPQDRFDDSGPYKSDMMARMEQLNRGDRVQPPCDRCRRLHMECLKNLTACMGCTRKHAKCSWKDVTEKELMDHPVVLRTAREEAMDASSNGEVEPYKDPYRNLPTISSNNVAYKREESRGVRDEEILGEEVSGDDEGTTLSTNGFESVNVKGVVVEYESNTQRDEKSETEQDRERDALIQLSAAAQQVSESHQQQRELSKEEADE